MHINNRFSNATPTLCQNKMCIFSKWNVNSKIASNILLAVEQKYSNIGYVYCYPINPNTVSFVHQKDQPYAYSIATCIVQKCTVDFLKKLFQHFTNLGINDIFKSSGISSKKSCLSWVLWDAARENQSEIVNFLIDYSIQKETHDSNSSNIVELTNLTIKIILIKAIEEKNCAIFNSVFKYINIFYTKTFTLNEDRQALAEYNKKQHANIILIDKTHMYNFIIYNINNKEKLITSLLFIALQTDHLKSLVEFDLISIFKMLDDDMRKSLIDNLEYLLMAHHQTSLKKDVMNLYDIAYNIYFKKVIQNYNIYNFSKIFGKLSEYLFIKLKYRIAKDFYSYNNQFIPSTTQIDLITNQLEQLKAITES